MATNDPTPTTSSVVNPELYELKARLTILEQQHADLRRVVYGLLMFVAGLVGSDKGLLALFAGGVQNSALHGGQ